MILMSDDSDKLTFQPVTPPRDGKWDLQTLKEHLQTAVTVELYTLPIYLYAAYSIKDEGSQARKDINCESTDTRWITQLTKIFPAVVKQEMLHLGLVGNILCAIGGTPKLYGERFTPKFPFKIFRDDVEVHLDAATEGQIATFVRVSVDY